MPVNEQEILNQPINNLPFTEDFKSFAKKLGVNTLAEMTAIPVKQIMMSGGFTYHSLQELTAFLENKGLSGLLKE
jgi:hypothetical protein